ncbi:biosynthesis-related protein [Naematelia encephala]|uniref:Glutamyl-tRNA(Gln) amidotransferase subunit B, mitochondrial n=1 Tax=Naematelia encephala TaxID=71784 RepID=A0A1Y2AHB3_9TREE|nr:biosynthesis-related protein [Naematelia encephala]
MSRLAPQGAGRLCKVCRHAIARRSYATTSNDGWETVIGLEIHAQLRTRRKLFSEAKLSYDAPANTHVGLFDAAFPGALPVLDLNAVRLSILTALVLQCNINSRSTFDRKHYFYHDIPAAYQITQHYNPIARSGKLQISAGEYGSSRDISVGIQQLQIEQDTAKSQQVGGDRLVDLNRAGTGLMEIVTDPDMRSAEEAGAFVRKLQALLRRVGSGDGDMEKGNLRIDANVSVNRPGEPFRTRCEIKNLNSVRFLQQAIECERKRHIAHYTSSSSPLERETRGMNELTGQTYSLRLKEDAEDYRYMPDTNLPALVIPPSYTEKLRTELPEMPWQTSSRLREKYSLAQKELDTLLALDEFTAGGAQYFEDVVQGLDKPGLARRSLNLIVHDTLGGLNRLGRSWSPLVIPAQLMREIVLGLDDGTVSGSTAKTIISHLTSLHPHKPRPTTLEPLLIQLNLQSKPTSSADLEIWCQRAIQAVPTAAAAVKDGKLSVVGRLIGEVMAVSQGRADPKKARQVLLRLLK